MALFQIFYEGITKMDFMTKFYDNCSLSRNLDYSFIDFLFKSDWEVQMKDLDTLLSLLAHIISLQKSWPLD